MSEAALDPCDDEALAELLELGLAAVRHVQARLLDAEAGKAVAELSLALGRVTRSMRQTLALKARLKRERLRQAKAAFEQVAAAETAQVARRRAQVEAPLARLIWSEHEHAEACELLEALEHHLAAEAADEAFCATPVATVIARICDGLGIDPPPPPQGEVSAKLTEGGSSTDSPPDRLSGTPLSPSATAPPEGEHLGPRAPPPQEEGDREAVERDSSAESPPDLQSGTPLRPSGTAPP